MASLAERYTKETYEQQGYWAAWEPNVHLDLGTCGPVIKGQFRPEGRLSEYGIDFNTEPDPTPADVDYSSQQGLDIQFQTRAGAATLPNIPVGTAGIRITWTRRHAVLIATKGAYEDRIADQRRLRLLLLDSVREADGMPSNWFVVTHLVRCEFASVLVAEGAGAEFQASASADLASGVVDLANADLAFTVHSANKIGYRMLAQRGATPLFRGLRVRNSWLRGPGVATFDPDSVAMAPGDAFEELTPATSERDEEAG